MARIKHGTLTAAQVETVTIDASAGSVEIVIVDNPDAIYFRVDGQDPQIRGDDCEVIPANIGASLGVDLPDTFSIRLISAGTPDYCVRGE